MRHENVHESHDKGQNIVEDTQGLINKDLLLDEAPEETPVFCGCQPGQSHSGKCKL